MKNLDQQIKKDYEAYYKSSYKSWNDYKKAVEEMTTAVFETIQYGVYIQAEYTHPESVKDGDLDLIAESAGNYLETVSKEDVYKTVVKMGLADDMDEASYITVLADEGCNHRGYETVTPVCII